MHTYYNKMSIFVNVNECAYCVLGMTRIYARANDCCAFACLIAVSVFVLACHRYRRITDAYVANLVLKNSSLYVVILTRICWALLLTYIQSYCRGRFLPMRKAHLRTHANCIEIIS